MLFKEAFQLSFLIFKHEQAVKLIMGYKLWTVRGVTGQPESNVYYMAMHVSQLFTLFLFKPNSAPWTPVSHLDVTLTQQSFRGSV